MSKTWVHELAHYHGYVDATDRLPDQTLRDENGNAIAGQKTYGVQAIVNLAKADKDQGARTADAYAWFAIAMYLSKWDWSKSFADDNRIF